VRIGILSVLTIIFATSPVQTQGLQDVPFATDITVEEMSIAWFNITYLDQDYFEELVAERERGARLPEVTTRLNEDARSTSRTRALGRDPNHFGRGFLWFHRFFRGPDGPLYDPLSVG
jgi:hypothetical protein